MPFAFHGWERRDIRDIQPPEFRDGADQFECFHGFAVHRFRIRVGDGGDVFHDEAIVLGMAVFMIYAPSEGAHRDLDRFSGGQGLVVVNGPDMRPAQGEEGQHYRGQKQEGQDKSQRD